MKRFLCSVKNRNGISIISILGIISLWLFLLFFHFLPVNAQQVSVDDAMLVAKRFMVASRHSKAYAKVDESMHLAYTGEVGGIKHYYIFNSDIPDGGYVIVGGDASAREVLGYSLTGTFDFDSAPDNVKWWLGQYDIQIAKGIEYAVTHEDMGDRKIAKSAPEWNIVEPMITTKWGQGYPYNSAIPSLGPAFIGNNAIATGCVATAVAQVMKKYNYPISGVGEAECKVMLNGVKFSANFETIYDWNNMLDDYIGTAYYDNQALAVGTLMYHIGVAVDVRYGLLNGYGSSALLAKVPAALVNHFKYDKGIRYRNRIYYTDDEWERIVYEELAAGRPVLYGGYANDESTDGHVFVCHGYKGNGLFAMNWGWEGHCDENGYVLSGSKILVPNLTGEGNYADSKSFSNSQEIVTNIMPDAGNDYSKELRWYSAGVDVYNVERGKQFQLDGSVINESTIANMNNVDLGVRMRNINTNEISYCVLSHNLDFKNGHGYNLLGWKIFTNTLKEGEYSVALVYKEQNEEWVDALVDGELPVITISESQSEYLITSEPTVGNSNYATVDVEKLQVRFNVQNNTKEDINRTFKSYVFSDETKKSVVMLQNDVLLPAGEEIEVVLPCKYTWGDLKEGESYSVDLRDNTTVLYSYMNMKVVDSKNITILQPDSGWLSLILPFESDQLDGMRVFACKGVHNNVLVVTEVNRIEQCKPYLVFCDKGEYSFSGPNVPSLFETYSDGLLNGILIEDYHAQGNDWILRKDEHGFAYRYVENIADSAVPQYSCVLNWNASHDSNAVYVMLPDIESGSSLANMKIDANTSFVDLYTLDGVRIRALSKGINMVRMNDGRILKVLNR